VTISHTNPQGRKGSACVLTGTSASFSQNKEEQISGKPALDIVIVDYNAGQLIRECLESVVAHPPKSITIGGVVVVDNASSDMTAEYIKGLDLPLHSIRNEQNRGFAAACNQGAAGSTADYLLFLNPDTRLMEGSLDVPSLFLDNAKNQSIGIVGIQLLDDDGQVSRTCGYHPRLMHFINKALGLSHVSPAFFPSGMMLEWDHSKSRQVEGVMGAFYFIRRSLFETLKGFDERFFVYFDETDFGLRAEQMGYRSYYLAEAQAYHYGGGTSEKVKAHRLFYSLQSRIRYGYKHFNWFSATMLLLVTLFIEPVSRLCLAIAHRSAGEMKETMLGYAMLWSSLPKTLHSVIR